MFVSMVKLKEEYDSEGEFKAYVDKYMRKHGLIDETSAFKCAIVQDYWLYLHGLLKD